MSIIVYVVTKNKAEAHAIAEAAVSTHLAACANIIEGMTSLFRWQGKIQRAQETIVILKTRQQLFTALKREILKHHSYECPCIVSWPIKSGHTPYLRWLQAETRARTKKAAKPRKSRVRR